MTKSIFNLIDNVSQRIITFIYLLKRRTNLFQEEVDEGRIY